MLRRRLSPAGPEVSQVTYGTMRLRSTPGQDLAPVDLLCHLHDLGIDTHHSSHEYDSHSSYLAALQKARATGRNFEHIVKLSSPSFDSMTFDGPTLERLVQTELQSLRAERLASVQWLVRTPDASDSDARTEVLKRQRDEIHQTFTRLLSCGDVANISIFPYSPEFARVVLDNGLSRTLATYLNETELEYLPFIDRLDGWIAIRPLAGGAVTENVADALRFPLLHPKVSTIVVSANSQAHIDQLVAATAQVEPDQDQFTDHLHQHSPKPAGVTK